MIIQSYNVSVSSQRTFLSQQSTSLSAAQSQNTAVHSGTSRQGQNQNGQGDQGQNVNNQGSGSNNGQGPGSNNGVGPGVNNGQGTGTNNGVGPGVNNGQGPGDVNNQGQNNRDAFRTMLKNVRNESVDRLARGSRASRATGRNQRNPNNPMELRAMLSQLIYEMITGRFAMQRSFHQQQLNSFNGWHQNGGHWSDFIGGIRSGDETDPNAGDFGIGFLQRLSGIAGASMQSFHFESETVSYQANGIIHTADGRTITVDITTHMSRQFVSFMGISTDVSNLVDPIVINYGGTAASLTGERFQFDLTMDGNLDSLSVLAEGSGFLAIDWNGDGIINDGSELFGPKTGCGFSDLRKYDTDGNGWIDANDEIFDKLVVWSRDKYGNDTVKTLAELGIGAIFLGDIATEFSFKSETNETLGVMRSTSFFLKQCGGAGTLSHIDLTTH